MSSTHAAPLAAVEHGLDDSPPSPREFRTTGEKDALVRLSRIVARVEAEQMRILAVSDDIALETGARSTAHGLADATRDGIGQVRRRERLATGAGERTCAAMGVGAVNVAQAREIVEALERLPKDLDPELREKGEAYRRPSTSGCWPGTAGPGRPPRSPSATAVTGPPISTPASRRTWRDAARPTWSPPPHPADGCSVTRSTSSPHPTAEQTRRLACQAGMLPVVLGGKGEILDLGRSKRLFTGPQRKAMAIRDRECTADGCTIPAAWCEAHTLGDVRDIWVTPVAGA